MKRLVKNRFVKNTGWILAGRIVQMVLSLAVNMLVARYLGPERHGIINYVNSFILFFSSLCTLGLNNVIIKELVSNKNEDGKILGSALFMRLISSLISMSLLIIIIYLLNKGDKLILLIAFLQSFSLVFSAIDVICYWYQSKLKSKVTTIAQTIAYLIMSLYKVLLVIFKKNLAWFGFSISLDYMLVAIILFIVYFKDKGQRLTFSAPVAKRMIKQSYPLIISGVMINIYGQIDKIMLGNMLDFSAVGLYTAAVTITGLWYFVPSSIIETARPMIIEAKDTSNELFALRLKQLYAILIYMSVAYGVFITLTAKYVIRLLYGQAYLGAQGALAISVWSCAFSLMGSANNIFLLAEGKTKFAQWVCVAGAITNIILNAIMIPLWGIKGAAAATLITQIFTNFIVPSFFKDIRIIVKYIIQAFLLKGVFRIK